MNLRASFIAMDRLEDRRLCAASAPSMYEQYMIELINRARANPSAEAARYGIELTEGLRNGEVLTADPKQPLAVNMNLTSSAQLQAQWLVTSNTFGHIGPGGSLPTDRMIAAGCQTSGYTETLENVACRLGYSIPNLKSVVEEHHRLMFDDRTNPDGGRGHRLMMTAPQMKEVGSGIGTGPYLYNGTIYQAAISLQDFGVTGTKTFLTGVAYTDQVTSDQFYTPGEGLGSITVTAVRNSDGATYSVQTMPSGGYSVALPVGTYTVTAAGTGLGTVRYTNVSIDMQNVKRDFTPAMATIDTTPPTIGSGAFLFQSSPMKITIAFSEPVTALTASDLELRKVGSSTLIPVTLAGIDASNVATFTINTPLANGDYRATLPAQSLTDAAGNGLALDYSLDFYVLSGDANHNRIVDSADFTIVAQNVNKTGMTFSQGDFTYDGRVNALDFNTLATNYGTTLTAAPVAAAFVPDSPASGPVSVPSLFSTQPIRSDLTPFDETVAA